MQRFIKVLLAIILTIFTIPFGGITAMAEDGEVSGKFKDGKYENVDYTVSYAGDGDSPVNLENFFVTPATLEIEDGIQYIEFKHTAIEMILSIIVPNNNVEVVYEDAEKDKRTVRFKVDGDLSKPIAMKLDMFYEQQHPVELNLDLTNVPTLPEKEEPKEPEDQGKVTVIYVDKDDNKIAEAETLEGKIGNTYETNKKDIDGYDFVEVKGDDTGEFTEDPITIEYIYEKQEVEKAPEEREVGSLVSESAADEVYELEYETDSEQTAGQLENPVTLLKKNGKQYIQIPINEDGAQFFRSLKFNGEEVIWNSITEGPYTIQYELPDGIDTEIDVSMVIDTGQMVMPHEDIKLSFDTEELEMTKVKDKRVTGDILQEEDAESVQLYDFGTDSRATAGQFKNPVKVLEKDNEKYLQIEVSGAMFFRSLAFNGEEVTWNSTTKAPNIIQYKLDSDQLPLGEDNGIDVSMIIQPPSMDPMQHDDINLWLNNTVSKADLNQPVEVNPNDRIVIDGSGNSLKPPANLPDDVSVTINSDKHNFKKYGNAQAEAQELELAGEVYEFIFENLGEDFDSFELVMEYDSDKFDSDDYDVDIYYFNQETGEWEAQGGDVANGQIIANVDHFSTYGVFAKEKPEPIVPKNEEEIDYVILHENKDKKSTADSFFYKPGILFEKDGKQYVEVTISNGDMVKDLKTKFGNAIIVEEKSDGSIVAQFRINDDLSDTELNMRIVVPGMYDTVHTTYFSLLTDDEQEAGQTPGAGAGKGKGTPPEEKPKKEKTDKVNPDKVSTIDYIIYQADVDEKSAADNFFEKPGILLEKDGEKYLQITIASWSLIDYLKYNGKNVLVIDEDKGKDTATVQLKIDGELSNTINLNMQITVPGVYENQEHDARLVLDSDSLEEVDSADYMIYTTPDKPEFGNGGKSTVEKTATDETKVTKTDNPKTGDTSKLFLYTMLLIGSLVPLGIQIRRRFIKA